MHFETNPSLCNRTRAYNVRPSQFQRSAGQTRIKKVQRKLTLKFKHILLLFVIISGIFYAGMRVYLYLISTESLSIKTVEIRSRQARVTAELRRMVEERALGNILLFDMAPLQKRLETHRWVKEARIRKIFPSALKIEILEREPAALLERQGGWALIDEDGVLLEPVPDSNQSVLPVLTGLQTYMSDYRDRLRLAWDCLKALSGDVKAEIDSLDLSEPGCVSLRFKDIPTRLILGRDHFQEKINLFREKRAMMENESGPPEYVDLRFYEDRIIFKPLPQPGPDQAAFSHQPKEVE